MSNSMENVARALKEGKMPTTAQAVRSLETIKEGVAEAIRKPELSHVGKDVLDKTHRVLDDTKKVIVEKNPDNELQELIANMRKLQFEDLSDMESVQQSYGQLGDETRMAINDVVQLTKLIAYSGEFRRGLRDVIDSLGGFLNVLQGVTAESLESIEGVINQYSARLPAAPRPKQPESGDDAKHIVQETGEKAGEATQILGEGVVKLTEKLTESGEKLAETLQSFDEHKLRDVMLKLKDSWKQLVSREEWQSSAQSLLRTLTHISNRTIQTLSSMRRMSAEEELSQISDTDRHHLDMIQRNAVKLLQNLTRGYSLDRLSSSFRTLVESSQSDENLGFLFSRLQDFLQRLLTDPSFIDSSEYMDQGQELAHLTKSLNPQFFGHFRQVLGQSHQFILAIANDRLLNQYAQDWTDLMSTLFLDSSGRPTLKPELLYDMTMVTKLIAERIKCLPVDDIVHSDDDFDYVLTNMKLAIIDVLPSFARVRYTSRLDMTKSPNAMHLLELKLSKIQTSASNIHFWYSKKTMPKMSDQGLLTLTTGEQGLILHLDIVPAFDESDHTFHVARVHANIPDMDFEINEAKHEILYSVLSPFLRQKIRSKIEEEIEKQITASLLRLDLQFRNLLDATREGGAFGSGGLYESGLGRTSLDQDELSLLKQQEPLPQWSSPVFGEQPGE